MLGDQQEGAGCSVCASGEAVKELNKNQSGSGQKVEWCSQHGLCNVEVVRLPFVNSASGAGKKVPLSIHIGHIGKVVFAPKPKIDDSRDH